MSLSPWNPPRPTQRAASADCSPRGFSSDGPRHRTSCASSQPATRPWRLPCHPRSDIGRSSQERTKMHIMKKWTAPLWLAMGLGAAWVLAHRLEAVDLAEVWEQLLSLPPQ